ncbi:hypothetical protein [Halomicrococcus sp. NG-SE-24]|uniref:hypothetical protein n=1 Tax=Halomicrococcus sp. NG-SE-24 TaxID=3436928 RepID=UPI003D998CBD
MNDDEMGDFRTKRGRCSVSDGVLRIDESYTGQLKRNYEGAKSSLVVFILFLAFIVSMVGWSVNIVLNERWVIPYLFGVFAIIAIVAYTIDYLRGFRQVETIPLASIIDVQVVKGTMWTHPRFIVSYKRDGEPYKRRIRLPSRHFAFTEQEFESAKHLFQTNGVQLSRHGGKNTA